MISEEADEIIKLLFDSFNIRYHNNLEYMKGSEFVTVALNHEEIQKDLQRITKIKPFALNVLYAKKEKICPAYVSKHNSNRGKQVFHLMMTNREKREAKFEGRRWHKFAVKNLSTLFIGITSKHCSNFCCLNCLHFFKTKNKSA